MVRLEFDGRAADINDLVIAGWTGRDVASLNHHIEELKAIGVQPPSKVPLYYRVTTNLLTQADKVQVLGDDTSGEVEPVLVGTPDRLWLTIGADHTDRKVESYGIAVGKQVCPKVLGRSAWRFEDVEAHWDRLILRSFIHEAGARVLYQEGPLARICEPRELIAGWTGGSKRLPAGVVMFLGTMPAIGAIRSSARFEMELDDPVRRAKLAHGYAVQALPIVS
jgi:hypothetical protein